MIKPSKFFPFLTMDEEGSIVLKKTHKYFFQVMGQLGVTQRKYAYFVVYTYNDLFMQKIEFDPDFFYQVMLSHLNDFYDQLYLPYVASHL